MRRDGRNIYDCWQHQSSSDVICQSLAIMYKYEVRSTWYVSSRQTMPPALIRPPSEHQPPRGSPFVHQFSAPAYWCPLRIGRQPSSLLVSGSMSCERKSEQTRDATANKYQIYRVYRLPVGFNLLVFQIHKGVLGAARRG